MNPMFMTMSSMELIMNNEATTTMESNPSISLPLLIGLSRSTYGSSSGTSAANNNAGNDKNTNGDNADTASKDSTGRTTSTARW